MRSRAGYFGNAWLCPRSQFGDSVLAVVVADPQEFIQDMGLKGLRGFTVPRVMVLR